MENKSNNLVFIIIAVVLAVLAICCCIFFSFYFMSNISSSTTSVSESTFEESDKHLEIAFDLEDKFGMEDVLIFENENQILEVRLKSPTNNNQNEIYQAVILIFDYLDQNISESVTSIRLIFTINSIDSGFIEVNRSDIVLWRDGGLSDSDFVTSFRRVGLVE